jgi:predicted RNA-binding protein with PIN domain
LTRGDLVTSNAAAQPLPPEVRVQLLTIAADVIGRRPLADLPPNVRRFARFSPSKRLRLGSAELAAALAVDEAFRESLAEVVREASGELVEQVVAGLSPMTADPVDVGVIVYLFRPDGWEEKLARIGATLQEEADRHTMADQTLRLTAERNRLAEANAELAKARDAARNALRASQAEHSREIGELRHQLRTLQGELRAAQRATAAAARQADLAVAEQQRQAAADAAELRRVRARSTALEAELDSGRRTIKSGRDHDDARLWLLLEQLGSGVAGLRRELDLQAPGVLPADTVEGADSQVGSRPSVLDGSLLDRMLDGQHVHLIVDGYNLTKTGYPDMTLVEQRNRLVASLGALASRTRVEVTVAFDGTAAPTGAAASLPTPRGVRVLFSAAGELADDLIRRLLAAEAVGRTVLVASSDGAVAASARARGAWSVPAAVLLGRIERG